MPSGLEILQEAIGTCKEVRDELESGDGVYPDWEAAVDEIVSTLDGLSLNIFFKTMPSVPASRACQRAAVAVKEAADKADWSGFPARLENLQ